MSGPPSGVDTGDGASGGYSFSDDSYSSYWEKKFGGGGDEDQDGGEGFDTSSLGPPSYTDTDKVLALVRLVLACCFTVLGIYALVRFYRSRWVLDIRTRSARLVMFGGICVLGSMFISINGSVTILWGKGLRWFWSSLLLFFITPALYGTYICRALRLAVVFHPRAKRAVPWLIPERNYLVALLVVSLAMLAIPIYHERTLPIWESIPKQTDILVTLTIVFAGSLACLFPFIRKVDDLFNISTELIVVTIAIVLLSAVLKLSLEYGGEVERRWGGANLTLLFSASVFGFSVVDPLRRLAFDPLAATKRNYADRVLLSRKESQGTSRTASSDESLGARDSEDEGRAARLEEGNEGRSTNGGAVREGGPSEDATGTSIPWPVTVAKGSGQRRAGGGREKEVWTFERLARTPLLAAAFEDFSRRALCHESVLFLSEVSRYQGNEFSKPTGASFAPSQFDTFCYITDTFVRAGSREEVNISDADKKRIVNWSHKGRAWFEQEDEEERRLVFGQAYVEVRNMLEANLLRRFLQTEQFRNVRMQRENITAMMVSPQQQED